MTSHVFPFRIIGPKGQIIGPELCDSVEIMLGSVKVSTEDESIAYNAKEGLYECSLPEAIARGLGSAPVYKVAVRVGRVVTYSIPGMLYNPTVGAPANTAVYTDVTEVVFSSLPTRSKGNKSGMTPEQLESLKNRVQSEVNK